MDNNQQKTVLGSGANLREGGTRVRFTTPKQDSFNSPEMIGSIQKILADNIGQYVVIEFLIGVDRIVRKQGILYFVGTSYVTLFDDMSNNYIVCDLYSIKFVYFYYPGERPKRNFNILPVNNGYKQ